MENKRPSAFIEAFKVFKKTIKENYLQHCRDVIAKEENKNKSN